MRMYAILAAIALLVAGLISLLARTLRASRQDRRRRVVVGARLAAAAVRAEETARQRRASAETAAALTTLLPAIQPAKEGPRRAA